MKRRLLAFIAGIVAFSAVSGTGAFADSSELDESFVTTWISTDAESEYGKRFSEYMGQEFDENSFFISHIMYDWEKVVERFPDGDWDENKVNSRIKAFPLDITISTTSESDVKMAIGIDTHVLSEGQMGFISYYGLCCASSHPTDVGKSSDDEFVISNKSEHTFTGNDESTGQLGMVLDGCRGILGFQVLNADEIEPGIEITVSYSSDVVIVLNEKNYIINDLDLGSVTYTFTGTEWVTDTDAGYYLDGETKNGVVRFLFKSNIEGAITQSGIKYIKGNNITDYVDGETSAVNGGTGTASAFYGDITGISENNAGTYYAVADVTVGDQTYWSSPVACTTNFDTQVEYSVEGSTDE